jgi:hypothetical protein
MGATAELLELLVRRVSGFEGVGLGVGDCRVLSPMDIQDVLSKTRHGRHMKAQ